MMFVKLRKRRQEQRKKLLILTRTLGIDTGENRWRGFAAEEQTPRCEVIGRTEDLLPCLKDKRFCALAQRKSGIRPYPTVVTQWRHCFVDQSLHQRVPTFKVVLQSAKRDVGPTRDRLQRCALEAFFAEQPLCRFDDFALRRFDAFTLRSSRTHRL